MADFQSVFNNNRENYNNNKLDHFFTQRKVTEYNEHIDKNMKRNETKKVINYNFLAINLPIFKNDKNIKLEIEIWGDLGYNFKGIFSRKEGSFPHLLVKLSGDTQLFVKLDINLDNGNSLDKFINFIQIPKRYQSIPILNDKKKIIEVTDNKKTIEVNDN
jgi:hypothetical protein